MYVSLELKVLTGFSRHYCRNNCEHPTCTHVPSVRAYLSRGVNGLVKTKRMSRVNAKCTNTHI